MVAHEMIKHLVWSKVFLIGLWPVKQTAAQSFKVTHTWPPQMLSNMKQPFPPEIPDLMRNSWLCNVRNVGGF